MSLISPEDLDLITKRAYSIFKWIESVMEEDTDVENDLVDENFPPLPHKVKLVDYVLILF